VFRRLKLPIKRVAVVALLMLAVSGCYMPLRFDAEIVLERTGHYSFIFDGYLAKVDIYEDLRTNKIKVGTPEERERVANVENDLKRDPSTKELKYHKKGVFKINWTREGDLIATRSVTFVRRNEHILGISYNKKTGYISLLGKSLSRDVKNQLREKGLDMSGQLRVITDAKVTTHNATSVKRFRKKGPNYKVYIWKFANLLAPTPSLKISMR